MRDFLTNFPFRALGVFAIIVGSFTYNILLDHDLHCTCKNVDLDCSTYMCLPFFIIFFLILWIDKTLQKTCNYTCNSIRCSFNKRWKRKDCRCCSVSCSRTQLCGVFWSHIFKAFCVGLLWVVSVLVDGDWYVCCWSKKEQTQLACKDKTNITAEENVTIGSLKNKSRIVGFIMLLVIIFLVALMSLWCDCCKSRHWCCCSRRAVYDKVILEQGEELLKEILTEAAKEKLTKNFFEKILENANGTQPADGGKPTAQPEDGGKPTAQPAGQNKDKNEDQWIKELIDVPAVMIESLQKPKLSREQNLKWKKLMQLGVQAGTEAGGMQAGTGGV